MYLHFTLQASCILYRPVNIHILYISTHSIYNVTYYSNHSISSPTIFALCTFALFHPYLLKLDLYRRCICCCSLLLFLTPLYITLLYSWMFVYPSLFSLSLFCLSISIYLKLSNSLHMTNKAESDVMFQSNHIKSWSLKNVRVN